MTDDHDQQQPGDRRMQAADAGHPGNPVALGGQLNTKGRPAVTVTHHGQDAGDGHQHHAGVQQEVPRLDQERGGRILLGAVVLLFRHPAEPQYHQHQQQRTDGDVPGHQGLANPVLAIGYAIKEFQQLPADQQGHQPVKPSGNTPVALSRVTAHIPLLSWIHHQVRSLPFDNKPVFAGHAFQGVGHHLPLGRSGG